MTDQLQDDVQLDRIERSIDIDAPADKVWELLEHPGWWINEGVVDLAAEVRTDGDRHVVVHEKWGEFRLETVLSDRPRALSYRWLDNASTGGTLVEFTIEEREGGVTLRVVESGFETLDKSREDVAHHVAENSDGWTKELAAARDHVVSSGSGSAG
ncbi:SRPBCC family protein [Nocardioides sp.]|uniref:SRPBCC domain-containing protein n=1 Tax=Nocardioides sp. TaxID=35761 RepID=UPI002727C504|nr:SRPBCC family protein [Nocardioides sp.]MDO9456849.1 SRPBCC family protein [Nocardioides sp.]